MNLLRAFTCQVIALAVTFGFAFGLPILHDPVAFLLTQGGLAAGCSLLFRQPYWWIPIHLLFLPCAFVLLTLALPSWLYFVVVVLMTLIFWGTIRGDVPLFLSSPEVAQALIILLQQEHATTFADLGSGIGSVAIPVAKQLAEIKVNAWERAPLPWLLSVWRGRRLANFIALRRNFFTTNFIHYDVVFAFLSPVAMPEVSEKIKREMRSGTLFISSSFPAPNWSPESIKRINDRRNTMLFCYRVN
ncbi:hypothetical protein [Methylobacter sp.]